MRIAFIKDLGKEVESYKKENRRFNIGLLALYKADGGVGTDGFQCSNTIQIIDR